MCIFCLHLGMGMNLPYHLGYCICVFVMSSINRYASRRSIRNGIYSKFLWVNWELRGGMSM